MPDYAHVAGVAGRFEGWQSLPQSRRRRIVLAAAGRWGTAETLGRELPMPPAQGG